MISVFSDTSCTNEIKKIIRRASSQLYEEAVFFCDDSLCVNKARLGICNECDLFALKNLQKAKIPVISCGMNSQNTVTLSSNTKTAVLVALQRNINDTFGHTLEPAEYPIALTESFQPFSIMASTAILLLNGIVPIAF